MSHYPHPENFSPTSSNNRGIRRPIKRHTSTQHQPIALLAWPPASFCKTGVQDHARAVERGPYQATLLVYDATDSWTHAFDPLVRFIDPRFSVVFALSLQLWESIVGGTPRKSSECICRAFYGFQSIIHVSCSIPIYISSSLSELVPSWEIERLELFPFDLIDGLDQSLDILS